MCYYNRGLSQPTSISQKLRCIVRFTTEKQICFAIFGAYFSPIVDQKLPKLQQDKRIYHNTPGKKALDGRLSLFFDYLENIMTHSTEYHSIQYALTLIGASQ